MSRVVLMCGPAGSGKSTVAHRLEAEGMTRLSIDGEAWQRGMRVMPLPEDVAVEIEQGLQARLLALVSAAVDVVLDFSFWSRRKRAEYRELLRPFGIVPETIYLATPRDVALARVAARARQHGDDFALTPEVAASYYDNFEPPTEDEGPLRIVEYEART